MTDWMALEDVRTAFANQVDYCRANDAPLTAAVVQAILDGMAGPGAFRAALRDWPGKPMADALPLRAAGGLHGLLLTGAAPSLAPLYAGEAVDSGALVNAAIDAHDAALLPWLDGPPQTNEAARSANYAAAMLWLAAQGLPRRFECIEIGSSAGINLMMDRYRYDLGGIAVGPENAAMRIAPDWRGPPPPEATVEIMSLRGCDVAPINLTDAEALLRLRAYAWPEHRVRAQRLEIAAAEAARRAPDLVEADAAAFVVEALARPQAAGTSRVLMHSIVWQYLGAERQAAITTAMEAAGAAATLDRPLAWIAVEANRLTFRHELTVRYWPGDGEPQLLGAAHPHGAWVEWKG
ncbi:DUF2332 domain-containing protein [Sphingomonas suaedae]|uniref:DUF2332 domain-containing protein n=1 Tax=Sphingomonas suaedae TaxID=2599297 RepID=A0A518RG27_9SPHN|nr:DUF2332 domain-containing protein [Sphingomonas suaedae]QDX26410.1 DUF2332 domain-containing protein [Sphingomonas suaedae]